ncbi:MAG: SCP2 sterol-binding domain-containing protein [Alphaproteobacteria bacterium]|nr:SCP2 sterol-binding domain-containing protein [Alphaproteobacteria bacterium]MDX5417109.1 SCP2 sterol-binding domain-containing protein [Alphaproteobacteria bacterium]MDX5494522.1 SCP2 sterol-binding domain-containing protein [Alphaproteobacteria bacterium]
MICREADRDTSGAASGKAEASQVSAAKQAEDEIAAILKSALTGDVSLGAVLKFVHPGAGVVVIDGRKKPNEVHRRDVPADCTVHVDPLLNLSILQRHTDQNTAFRQGKIRIVGDVSVVARLRPIMLRRANAEGSHD